MADTVSDVRLYARAGSQLIAGDYRLNLVQQLNVAPGERLTFSQAFTVVVPRFALRPDDLYTVFPPANAEGDFERVLPQAVLSAASLPWARRIDRLAAEGTPWLALLVFDPCELLAPLSDRPFSEQTRAAVYRVDELAEAGVFRPVLPEESAPAAGVPVPGVPAGSALCQAIDVDAATFLAIAPRLDELPFLAHVREVDAAGVGAAGAGAAAPRTRFAVVLANRFPAPDRRSVAHLVSLEGLAQHLPGGPRAGELAGRVRLISLAAWSWVDQPGVGDFVAQVASATADGVAAAGAAAVARSAAFLPEAAFAAPLPEEYGYVRLHRPLAASRADSGADSGAGAAALWYRGPLVPVDAAPGAADEAVAAPSYAAARELGRLLALADRSFTAAVAGWRTALHAALNRQVEQQAQAEAFGLQEGAAAQPKGLDAAFAAPEPGAPATGGGVAAALARQILLFSQGELPPVAAPRDFAAPEAAFAESTPSLDASVEGAQPAPPRGDPSGLAGQLARMPGLAALLPTAKDAGLGLDVDAAAGFVAPSTSGAPTPGAPTSGDLLAALHAALAGILASGADPTDALIRGEEE